MRVYYLRGVPDIYRGVLVTRGKHTDFVKRFSGNPIVHPLPDVTIEWDPTALRFPKGDYPALDANTPIFTRRAVTALADLLERNGELIPISVSGEEHYLFNVTRVIDALDESRSSAVRFDDGRIIYVKVHYLFADRIRDAPIFKIPQTVDSDVFVTDEFVTRVESARLKGFLFPFLWSLDETGETTRELGFFD